MALFVLTAQAQAGEQLLTLATRSGVEQKFLFLESPKPRASVILFAGGKRHVKALQRRVREQCRMGEEQLSGPHVQGVCQPWVQRRGGGSAF